MNITLTLGLIVFVLVFVLIGVIKVALDERKKKLAYKAESERKTNTINYLNKHFEELDRINRESDEIEQELKDADTDEEVLDVINSVIDRNNDRVRKQAQKKRNSSSS